MAQTGKWHSVKTGMVPVMHQTQKSSTKTIQNDILSYNYVYKSHKI